MIVRQILTEAEAFPTIVTDVTVVEAAHTMREAGVRAVPIVEGDKLVGIVTDWDIVDAFAVEGEGLAERPVSAIMTSNPLITIEASSTVAYATAKLQEKRVHHLPVLEDGRYVGMICLGTEWNDGSMMAAPVRPTLTARRP